MTTTADLPVAMSWPDADRARFGARLLIIASWSFLLLIGLMLGSVAAAGFPSEEPVTHAILDPIRGLRIAVAWALLIPAATAATGSVLLAYGLHARRRTTTVLVALWVAACAATALYAVMWSIGCCFTTPTILDDPSYRIALVVCRQVAVPLLLAGSAATAVVVRGAGIAPRVLTALAVAAILVALVFAVTGAEYVPPAIVVLIWIPCAILARRRIRAQRSTVPQSDALHA